MKKIVFLLLIVAVGLGAGYRFFSQRGNFRTSADVTLDYIVTKEYVTEPNGSNNVLPPDQLFMLEAKITNHRQYPIYFFAHGCASSVFYALPKTNGPICLALPLTEQLDSGETKIFSSVTEKGQKYRFELGYWLENNKYPNGSIRPEGKITLTSDPIRYTEKK